MKGLSVGSKVKIKNAFGRYENRIGVITEIRDDNSFTFPILVDFGYKNFNIPFKSSDLEIVEYIPKSINAIQHDNGSIVRWRNIDGLNLKVNIDGRVNVTTLCKILLNYVEGLDNFTYKRVCPYKLIHEYARDRDDKTHLFYIKYLTVQEEIKTQNIIQTDCSMSITKGEYDFFIPDLLEVARDRNLVVLEEDTYICNKKRIDHISACCKEIKTIDRVTLESEGWIVPSQFEKYFNKIN